MGIESIFGLLNGQDALSKTKDTLDPVLQQNMSYDLMSKQSKLNSKALAQQVAAQKELYEYTGYGSKVRQMKDAGLNPALIYGGGGAGVTGNVSAPQVGLPSAPNFSAFQSNRLANNIAMAKMQSEIELNKASAESLRSHVPLNAADTDTKNFDLGIKKDTRESTIYKNRAESNTAGEIENAAARENRIGNATEQAHIDLVLKDVILMDKKINLTEQQTNAVVQEAKRLAKETEYIPKNYNQRQLQIEVGLENFLKERTDASQRMSQEEINDVARNLSHVAGIAIGGAIVGAGTKTIQKVDKDGNTTWEEHKGK